jgi:hypothetical protein
VLVPTVSKPPGPKTWEMHPANPTVEVARMVLYVSVPAPVPVLLCVVELAVRGLASVRLDTVWVAPSAVPPPPGAGV